MLAKPQRDAKIKVLWWDSGGTEGLFTGAGGGGAWPAACPCVPGVPSLDVTPSCFPDGGNKHGHFGLVLNVNGVISAISPPRRGNLFWPIKPGEAMPC